ncbi:pyridine nucleotide-disulfide oxidoreductase [Fulvimarina endophytica]|uniref:Pyridine nucleotide-disulfide oxidoreductase n=1 Tax=Fulvimarina endophytica TaxID=2293836 RepID=A0A371WYW7_9HYPH|nr:FAD-dependent oxidoreductase [Fulvimarina endophytica]RFC62181.1 pyridine nucleotide-disulfide oxidoreductase [Fulvimarina endophytica]
MTRTDPAEPGEQNAAPLAERILVVGAGHAAVQLAANLRQEGHEGSIILIGDEPGLPYQRPPLSKAYMKDGDAERLVLKPQSFFEKNAIERRESARVVSVDRAGRTVRLEDGETIGYDHLVFATGARNARPPIEGADREGIAELRSLAHARAIRDRLEASMRAIVVGGGFIGLEFAAMAEAAGVATTVLEAGSRLMARAVSPAISARFLAHHRLSGTDVRLGAKVVAIEARQSPDPERVHLESGEVLEGDLVLVATGVRANSELAEAAGLACENGITVDETLSTEDAAVSAIGDCAAVPGAFGARERLESIQAATDQARHLARRLTGKGGGAYHAVPWFWSDQGPLKLQIAGLTAEARAFVEAGEDMVLGFREDRLVSVETVNRPGDHMAARKILAGDEPPSRAALEAVGFDLRAFAKASKPEA